jgi:hypothetical protein
LYFSRRRACNLSVFGATSKFSVSGCLFAPADSGFPANFSDESSTFHFYDTATASHIIAHLNTGYCPTASPTASPSPTRLFLSGRFADRDVIPDSDKSCIHIRECLFHNIQADSGGAVFIHNSAGTLFLLVSIFVDCRSSGWAAVRFTSVQSKAKPIRAVSAEHRPPRPALHSPSTKRMYLRS